MKRDPNPYKIPEAELARRAAILRLRRKRGGGIGVTLRSGSRWYGSREREDWLAALARARENVQDRRPRVATGYLTVAGYAARDAWRVLP